MNFASLSEFFPRVAQSEKEICVPDSDASCRLILYAEFRISGRDVISAVEIFESRLI